MKSRLSQLKRIIKEEVTRTTRKSRLPEAPRAFASSYFAIHDFSGHAEAAGLGEDELISEMEAIANKYSSILIGEDQNADEVMVSGPRAVLKNLPVSLIRSSALVTPSRWGPGDPHFCVMNQMFELVTY